MNKTSEQLIEEYLDTLSAQLGTLPPEIQQETREELRQHLRFLVKRQHTPQRITESALRQFGDPTEIGRRLALEWEEGEWSLSGLPLLHRIDKIRDAGCAEIALHSANTPVKVITYCQASLPLLYAFLSPTGLGTPIVHLSPALLTATSFGVWGLYFVLGMMACFLEWRGVTRLVTGSAPNHRTVRNNIVARGAMSLLLPSAILFPTLGGFAGVAIMLMPLLLLAMTRSQPSPRARLSSYGSMGYGALMGLVLSVLIFGWLGTQSWHWLLLLPLSYAFNRWFWKRPVKI